MQWLTIFNKEILEHWRNKKWIWVPLVIILLSVMEPITFYYLPEILDIAGGMPEGAVFEVPPLEPSEVVMMSLEQLSMFGVLIIILISMGTIAGERKSGIAEIIFVKPIKYTNYITAKWTALLLLSWLALFLGLLLNWYYTNLLFGEMHFMLLLKIVFFYGLWFTFVLTLSIFYNTFIKTPGIVLASTVATLIIMNIINTILGHKLTLFPNQLSAHIVEMMETNTITNGLIGTSSIVAALIVILLVASTIIFEQKEVI